MQIQRNKTELLLAECHVKFYMIKTYKHAFRRYRLQQALLQSQHKHADTAQNASYLRDQNNGVN